MFLMLLKTHNISINYNAIAEAWRMYSSYYFTFTFVINGMTAADQDEKPTARAISERLIKMRKQVAASGGGSVASAVVKSRSVNSTPSKPKLSRPAKPASSNTPSAKRRRTEDDEDLYVLSEREVRELQAATRSSPTPTPRQPTPRQLTASSRSSHASSVGPGSVVPSSETSPSPAISNGAVGNNGGGSGGMNNQNHHTPFGPPALRNNNNNNNNNVSAAAASFAARTPVNMEPNPALGFAARTPVSMTPGVGVGQPSAARSTPGRASTSRASTARASTARIKLEEQIDDDDFMRDDSGVSDWDPEEV